MRAPGSVLPARLCALAVAKTESLSFGPNRSDPSGPSNDISVLLGPPSRPTLSIVVVPLPGCSTRKARRDPSAFQAGEEGRQPGWGAQLGVTASARPDMSRSTIRSAGAAPSDETSSFSMAASAFPSGETATTEN